jgi:hypothetical protein
VHTLDRLSYPLGSFEEQFDVNTPDYEHTSFRPNLTCDLSYQATIASIDLARFQRAAECAHHSTAERRNNVIQSGGMRFLNAFRRHPIVLSNGAMDAKKDRLSFSGKMGNP